MKWQRWVVVSWIAMGSLAAWGQATAEYGLAASKSAAAASAVTDKLNRSSAAAVAAAGDKAARASGGATSKTAPASAAPRASQGQRHSQAEAKQPIQEKPALAPETASPVAQPAPRNLQPAGISLSRGAVAKERAPSTRYPGVVRIESAAPPQEKADKAAAPKPPQP